MALPTPAADGEIDDALAGMGSDLDPCAGACIAFDVEIDAVVALGT